MRPVIICYMLSSVDGRIDCSVLDPLIGESDYETIKKKLEGDAWICGRVTMELHFAEKEPFVPTKNERLKSAAEYVAVQSDSYAIAVDTFGKLRWPSNRLEGDPLICITSEEASVEYLETLQKQGISYIAVGKGKIDWGQAMERLSSLFGVKRLILEGGGLLNGGLLEAGLIDELSLLIAPGIDGRSGIPTLFNGISANTKEIVFLRLKELKPFPGGAVWIHYEVNYA